METSEKIRILAIGDLHGDSSLAKKIAKKAKRRKVDLVILAGDLTMFEMSKKNIIGPFLGNNREILILNGNHETRETVDYLANKYSIKNLNHAYFKKGNLAIFGAGGASEIGPYITEDDEIGNMLKNSHRRLNAKEIERKIMVTHMHPRGSKSEFTGIEGSEAIRKAVEKFKPEILIHGHIHEAGGIEEKIGKTRVFNVARKEKFFEI